MTKFLLAATIAAGVAISAPAFAQQGTVNLNDIITVTENSSLPYGNYAVTMNTGPGSTQNAYAGQQELTVTGSTNDPGTVGENLYVWCVDWGHDIYLGQGGYTFTVSQFSAPPVAVNSSPPVTFSTGLLNKLNWLANYGNNNLPDSNPNVTTLAQSSAQNTLVSMAVQVAMWRSEYGFTLNHSTANYAALNTEVNYILNLFHTDPEISPVSLTPVVLVDQQGVQELSTLSLPPSSNTNTVPEPASLGTARRRPGRDRLGAPPPRLNDNSRLTVRETAPCGRRCHVWRLPRAAIGQRAWVIPGKCRKTLHPAFGAPTAPKPRAKAGRFRGLWLRRQSASWGMRVEYKAPE